MINVICYIYLLHLQNYIMATTMSTVLYTTVIHDVVNDVLNHSLAIFYKTNVIKLNDM